MKSSTVTICNVYIILTLALAMAGCSPQPTMDMTEPLGNLKYVPAYGHRFRVDRVAVFADNLAYGNRRGIYIISDSETGKTFIGVSGIGISEMGRHPVGKTTLPDER